MANPYLPSSSYASSSKQKIDDQPVTRSRTLFYLSVRDSSTFAHGGARGGPRLGAAQYGDTIDVDDDERGGLLQSHARVDMKGLPPQW